jgi:hypothetical protein
MPVKISITQSLYGEALAQMIAYFSKGKTHLSSEFFRQTSKDALDRALWKAYELIRTGPAQQKPLDLETNDARVHESTRMTLRESREKTNRMFAETRRAQIIELVKGEQLSIDVAIKLVDELTAEAKST